MNAKLQAVYNLILQVGGFAFDFEAVDAKGRPCKEPLIARPTLLAVASGATKNSAICVEWNEESKEFLRSLLYNEKFTAVCHYGYFDYMLAHWAGIDIHGVRAKMSDTRLLCWLENEERQNGLGIKELIDEIFGYKMKEFMDAFDNEFEQAIRNLNAKRDEDRKKLKAEIAARKAEYKRIVSETCAEIEKSKELKRVDKIAAKAKAKANGERLLTQIVDTLDAEFWDMSRNVDRTTEELKAMSHKLMKSYAADDARQCWRLFKHQMNWIKNQSLEKWLDIELANFRRSLLMTADGTYIDVGVAEDLIRTSEPILEEFKNDICNLAKREINLNSPIQLAEAIYRDLGVEVPDGVERSHLPALKDKPWGYSTDSEALERISHPIGRAILDWRAVDTIHKNFMIGLLDQAKNDPNGKSRVHVTLNSTGTVTGRWSSSA